MPCITIDSPIGNLTVHERDGAIVALNWDGAGGEPEHETPLLARARAQLGEYFAGDRHDFDLPLAPAGTEFLQSLWRALLRIPYGRTLTYGELARTAGTAPRAAGLACGRNPIAILIPCHRVVAAGGKLTGYSGGNGIATKRMLLDLEARLGSGVRPLPGLQTAQS
jgi:methylated-DNA-[protein]-cysteine S-methyltransferase